MTDQKDAPDSSKTPDETTAEDEAADAGSTTDPNESTVDEGAEPKSGAGGGIAWLGLVLALVGLGGVGWLAWEKVNEPASDLSEARIERIAEELRTQAETLRAQSGRGEAQGERLEGLVGDLAELRSRLEEAAGQSSVAPEEVERLRASIESQARTTDTLSNELDALAQRVDSGLTRLDEQINSLQARRDDRVNESLARAEYRLALVEMAGLLRVARIGARLGDDPATAIEAYEQALSRAGELQDARADRLREALAGELEALRGMSRTDWPALVGRLGALEAQSADWALAGRDSTPAEPEADSDDAAQVDDAGWWSDVRRSLGGLVRVTPRESAPLGPAAAESVRERVRLHLAGAQVAATRRDPQALEPHLSAVEDLIDTHFDPEAVAIRQARIAIEDAASVRAADWPDLDASLAEIERQLDGS